MGYLMKPLPTDPFEAVPAAEEDKSADVLVEWCQQLMQRKM